MSLHPRNWLALGRPTLPSQKRFVLGCQNIRLYKKERGVYTVHLKCGICFGYYTTGNHEEIQMDFKEGNDHNMHFRNIILGTVYRLGWREAILDHKVETKVMQLVGCL